MFSVCLPHFQTFCTKTFCRWSGLARIIILAGFMAGAGPAFAADEGEDQAEKTDTPAGVSAGRAASAAPSITVEGIVIARDKPNSTPLTGPNRDGVDFTAVTSSDMDGMGDISGGIRATFRGEVLNQPLEYSAFYVFPFIAEELKTGLSIGSANATPTTNAIYANDPGGDISSYTNSQNITSLHAKHLTKLFGAEVNALDVYDMPGLLIGARAIYFGEELDTVTTKLENPVDPDTKKKDAVSIQTDNYLVGFQLGLQHMWDVGDGIKVGGSLKGGLYANLAERRRSFISANNTKSRAQQDSLDDLAFSQAIEFNPRIEYEIAKGVSLTASGTLMWLNNVSGAFPQYATATDLDDRNIRANDDVFFYGAMAGITVNLDEIAAGSSTSSSGDGLLVASDASPADVEARIAELEATTVRGQGPVSIDIYGQVNRMVLAWSDGGDTGAHIVDNVNSPSLFGIEGAARISRGWTAGYEYEFAVEDTRSNSVSQLTGDAGEGILSTRFSALWLRNSRLGTVTTGLTGTATDNIILTDLGGTALAGSPSIALVGGDFILRAADDPDAGDDALITRTSIGDFVGGATLDTLRREVVRYDSPSIAGFQLSASAGEDFFWDAALRYRLNWDDWRFRAGFGYLRDTDNGDREGIRDRREWKGSASLMHVPTGVFLTGAFVNREFHGTDDSNQAVFGEQTVGLATEPGTNRPDLQYGYLKTGIRREFFSAGETKLYAEGALAMDGITGLQEAGPLEVTDSQLKMLGFGIIQDIDSLGMELYLAARHYEFDVEGVRDNSGGTITSPSLIEDIDMIYAGTRIRF
jgi:predicted porin